VLPQLLHAVPEGEEAPYLDSPDWIMQQKHDGERRPVKTAAPGEPITGINRKGEAVGLSKAAAAEIAALAVPHLVLDAEAVGDRLYVFDLLEYGGTDIRAWPFARRYRQLREVLAALSPSSVVELVPVYVSLLEKRRAFEKLRVSGAEGVVFKLASAPYESGRPASGGPAMKFKFWHEASVLVEQVNAGKRSVSVSVLSPKGDRVDIGSVSIPANQDIPKAGAILEVRYLYAFLGGSLYQTTSKGVRDDIEPSACTQDQLVYKRVEELDYAMSPAPT
jgi:ATP-dependent DNA ligase